MDKKTFHTLKEPMDLLSVNTDQIVVSDKLKHNNKGFKYFIRYYDRLVRPLCFILPQMSGYINILKTGVKTCLF